VGCKKKAIAYLGKINGPWTERKLDLYKRLGAVVHQIFYLSGINAYHAKKQVA
jgi:hypothetical protein